MMDEMRNCVITATDQQYETLYIRPHLPLSGACSFLIYDIKADVVSYHLVSLKIMYVTLKLFLNY